MIEERLEDFLAEPTEEKAMTLGELITISSLSLKERKRLFARMLDHLVSERLMAITNMWTVANMIEDDIPLPHKMMQFRGVIEDEEISTAELEHWIRIIWKVKRVSTEILQLLAKDIVNIGNISEDIIKLVS